MVWQILRGVAIFPIAFTLLFQPFAGSTKSDPQSVEAKASDEITRDERRKAARTVDMFEDRFLETGDLGAILVDLGSYESLARALEAHADRLPHRRRRGDGLGVPRL